MPQSPPNQGPQRSAPAPPQQPQADPQCDMPAEEARDPEPAPKKLPRGPATCDENAVAPAGETICIDLTDEIPVVEKRPPRRRLPPTVTPARICRHWARGNCTLGGECAFAHPPGCGGTAHTVSQGGADSMVVVNGRSMDRVPSDDELRRSGMMVVVKSREPCRGWSAGYCARGDACRYAHSALSRSTNTPDGKQPDGSRHPHSSGGGGGGFPRRRCREWLTGQCMRGSACRFAHSLAAAPAAPHRPQRQPSPPPPQRQQQQQVMQLQLQPTQVLVQSMPAQGDSQQQQQRVVRRVYRIAAPSQQVYRVVPQQCAQVQCVPAGGMPALVITQQHPSQQGCVQLTDQYAPPQQHVQQPQFAGPVYVQVQQHDPGAYAQQQLVNGVDAGAVPPQQLHFVPHPQPGPGYPEHAHQQVIVQGQDPYCPQPTQEAWGAPPPSSEQPQQPQQHWSWAPQPTPPPPQQCAPPQAAQGPSAPPPPQDSQYMADSTAPTAAASTTADPSPGPGTPPTTAAHSAVGSLPDGQFVPFASGFSWSEICDLEEA